MNARQPTPLAHVPTGITIRWSRGLDALYPEHERGPKSDVTVDVGLLFGRLVVQLLDGGPWLHLKDLPDHVAEEVRFMEREAYISWRERTERERERAAREDALGAEWEWRSEYRRYAGF